MRGRERRRPLVGSLYWWMLLPPAAVIVVERSVFWLKMRSSSCPKTTATVVHAIIQKVPRLLSRCLRRYMTMPRLHAWRTVNPVHAVCSSNNNNDNNQRALIRGSTDNCSNILADRKTTQLLLLIYSFKFRSAFLYYLLSALAEQRSAIRAVNEVKSCFSFDSEFWLTILTFELDLDRAKMNQRAKI